MATQTPVIPATSRASVSVTVIDVSEVSLATEALPEVPYKEAVEALLSPGRARTAAPRRSSVEACARYHGRLVARVPYHPFVAAVHRAFQDHRPLVLSPDVVWLLVAQGFAHHVNANAKALRPQLVRHQGRAVIEVRRDDFIKGSPENPWAEVFAEFGDRVRDHIGEATHDLLEPDFSTTGPTERAASQVVLLSAVRSFFAYEVHSMCGIPQVILEGTADDWTKLAVRVQGLAKFGLHWWADALGPILAEFIAAANGQADARFWKSIYKRNGGSGGPYIGGWLNAFFPYLKHWKTGEASLRNERLAVGGNGLRELLHPSDKGDSHGMGGPTAEQFPSGLAAAPFTWKFSLQSFEMEFLGGFVGVRQDADTLRLKPEIGWAIREQPG